MLSELGVGVSARDAVEAGVEAAQREDVARQVLRGPRAFAQRSEPTDSWRPEQVCGFCELIEGRERLQAGGGLDLRRCQDVSGAELHGVVMELPPLRPGVIGPLHESLFGCCREPRERHDVLVEGADQDGRFGLPPELHEPRHAVGDAGGA